MLGPTRPRRRHSRKQLPARAHLGTSPKGRVAIVNPSVHNPHLDAPPSDVEELVDLRDVGQAVLGLVA